MSANHSLHQTSYLLQWYWLSITQRPGRPGLPQRPVGLVVTIVDTKFRLVCSLLLSSYELLGKSQHPCCVNVINRKKYIGQIPAEWILKCHTWRILRHAMQYSYTNIVMLFSPGYYGPHISLYLQSFSIKMTCTSPRQHWHLHIWHLCFVLRNLFLFCLDSEEWCSNCYLQIVWICVFKNLCCF